MGIAVAHRKAIPLNFDDKWPFIRTIAHSANMKWEGVHVALFDLFPCDPDVIPSIYMHNHNINVHLKGGANKLKHAFNEQHSVSTSTPGALILYPYGSIVKTVWSEYAQNFNISITPRLIHDVAKDTLRIDPNYVEIIYNNILKDNILSSYANMLLHLLQNPDLEGRLYAEQLGISIAWRLLFSHSASDRPIVVYPKRADCEVKVAVDYMHVYHHNDLTIEEIAKQSGISKAHFSRLFHKSIGTSPYQYLMKIRIERAYDLLKSQSHTVAEVAQKVGFYDQSHLTRQFKRVYGISPRDMLM